MYLPRSDAHHTRTCSEETGGFGVPGAYPCILAQPAGWLCEAGAALKMRLMSLVEGDAGCGVRRQGGCGPCVLA